MKRAIFALMLMGSMPAAAADAPKLPNFITPPTIKFIHGAWLVKPPAYIDRFFDDMRRTTVLRRDIFLADDGIEVDLFTADYWGTEGLWIRNENEHAADVTMTGCRFVKTLAGRASPGKDGLRGAKDEANLTMDAPNSVHMVLPPYSFGEADLVVSGDTEPGRHFGMLSKNTSVIDCKFTVTHPPS